MQFIKIPMKFIRILSFYLKMNFHQIWQGGRMETSHNIAKNTWRPKNEDEKEKQFYKVAFTHMCHLKFKCRGKPRACSLLE